MSGSPALPAQQTAGPRLQLQLDPPLNSCRQGVEVHRFNEVLARAELIGHRTRSRICRPGDDDGSRGRERRSFVGTEGPRQAQVENNDLAGTQRAQPRRRLGVVSETSKAARGQIGKPLIVVEHENADDVEQRRFDDAEHVKRLAEVPAQSLSERQVAVRVRQLELDLHPR